MHLTEDKISAYLETLKLRSGSGDGGQDVCVMQAVDYIASGGASDHPECASPVITDFMIALNDRLSDARRQRLKKFIPQLIGTRGDDSDETKRRYTLRDFAVRTIAPTWFDLAGFPAAAQKLRDLPAIVDAKTKSNGVDVLWALRSECWPGVLYCGRYSSYYNAVYNAVWPAVEKALKAKLSATAAATTTADDATTAAAADAAAAAATATAAAAAADAAAATAAAADAATAADADAADATATAATAATADAADAWYVYCSDAYRKWRADLRAKVREAVLARLEEKWGVALERNMQALEAFIPKLIAVHRDASAAE